MNPILAVQALMKSYWSGDGSRITILQNINLEVQAGEFVAIIGQSGAGKSTLLHLIGALDTPTGGAITLNGIGYDSLAPAELAALRNRDIGMVFQFHHLLRDFTALENVSLPMEISGIPKIEARHRARLLLDDVGLRARETHLPSALSGGEQQRVAVARALAMAPKLLLADEPSGNLDRPNAERLHDLLGELAPRFGAAVIAVTHNPGLAAMADRVLELRDGALEAVISVEHSGGFDGRTL